MTVRGEAREVPLRGVGGVFGGAGADAGSSLLLESLDREVAARRVELGENPGPMGKSTGPTGERPAASDSTPCTVDLGCGNGLLTAYLCLAFPDSQVIASDDDIDAVFSTRATIDALRAAALGADVGKRVEVTWDDAVSSLPDRCADLVLLNPPFHDGTAVDATLVHGLLDAAARVLRPGGRIIVGEEFFGPEYVRACTVDAWAGAAGLRRVGRQGNGWAYLHTYEPRRDERSSNGSVPDTSSS